MVYNAREVGLQPNVYLDDAQSWKLLVRAIDRFAKTGFQQVLPVYVLDSEAMRYLCAVGQVRSTMFIKTNMFSMSGKR